MSLTTQQIMDINEAIGMIILNNARRLTGEYDMSNEIHTILALAEMNPDHRLTQCHQWFVFRDNEVFNQHFNQYHERGSKESRYYSTCVLKMLISRYISELTTFLTLGEYDVQVRLTENTGTISYHCPTTAHTVALDVWELDLVPFLKEINNRVDWVAKGQNVQSYPLREKLNHYHELKDAK